ncbi:MAG: TlyA family RNA methyltransferase [Bryobacterales bacterium]|nr:TlyA family RNA methyltransferase [Bryobacterales bacterium]
MAKPAPKIRLDQLVFDRGLAESREKARALILAGSVTVNGQRADKPGHSVAADVQLEIAGRSPYVGRGGYKLAAAIDRFAIPIQGAVCVDIGASTGGFTDCLLQRGAARVHSIDVGHGQLDWKLRNDPRVIVKEGVNARYLTPADIGEPCDVAVCDVSFISVTLIVPVVPPLLKSDGRMVILVKPQFEVGKGEVGKGGIVRDTSLHEAVCDRVKSAVEALGFQTALTESPILGAEGNREFLLYGWH